MNDSTHIFSVRGRPVGFVPGWFGGALVAIERGYLDLRSTEEAEDFWSILPKRSAAANVIAMPAQSGAPVRASS